jgi:RNA polymerase sigma factor (TIGR02999 family)
VSFRIMPTIEDEVFPIPPTSELSFEALYEELLHLARIVRQGRAGETMSTTVLVHEAYVKLASKGEVRAENRLHFLRLAARAMRQILVDAARAQVSAKRGGKALPVTLDDTLLPVSTEVKTLLMLDQALQRLSHLDPRAARVVECRFFGGLTVEETASALGIAPRTVKRDWRVARAFLAPELAGTVP